MKHPFQSLVADPSANCIFTVVKNHIKVFKLDDVNYSSCTLIGAWDDLVESDAILKKQQKEKIKLLEQQKKASGEEIKIPKIPTPGPGAPPINSYIRSLDIFIGEAEKYLVATTDNDKAVVIFKIDYTNKDNCLELLKRQPLSKRPCSISIDAGFKNVIVADKFGDVYSTPVDSIVVDEKTLSPILGHVSMLTDVKMVTSNKSKKQFILTADRDEHIKVSNYPTAYVVKQWLFGHQEYVSVLHALEGRDLLVSGGGDDYICLWNWYSNELLDKAQLREILEPYFTPFHQTPERFLTETSVPEISVSKIVSLADDYLLVLVENVKCLILFKIENDSKLALKQVLPLQHALVDIAVLGDKIICSQDTTDDDILVRIDFNETDFLKVSDTTFTGFETIDVESKDQLCPLWYVNSLRKRSEH